MVSSSRMSWNMILYFLILLLTILGPQATKGNPSFPYKICENDKGYYEANSTYKANLNQAFSILLQSATTDRHGFYTSYYGKSDDKVYMSGLCRGDAKPETCHSCLESSSRFLGHACPKEKEAFGGFEQCVLRYSNRSFFGLMESRPRFYFFDNPNVSFNYKTSFFRNISQVATLLSDLRDEASAGGSLRKYATRNTSLGIEAIYGLVQCTPDLSKMDCDNCLEQLFAGVPNYGILGGSVVAPSCNFRFETFLFYGPTYYAPPPAAVLAPLLPLTNTTAHYGKKSKAFGFGGIVTTGVSVIMIVSVGVYSRVRKRNKSSGSGNGASFEAIKDIGCVGFLGFDFSSIKAATNNFSERNEIGRSTVGAVYKGRLSNGQEIAVKSYRKNGQHRPDHFENEVLFGAKMLHRNLVVLHGVCSERDERFLVYEYLPLSLDRLLFDPTRRKSLSWDKRFKIIQGIANALLYLHEDSGFAIVHGDIKSSKVLLDLNLNPKISTFGSAKYFGVDPSDPATTRVVGTLGYLDPEYVCSGLITVKSDVFSFGVLLLEIVSGQRSGSFWRQHEETFVSYVTRNWRTEKISNIVDPHIKFGNLELSEIARCVEIGLQCAQPRSHDRPTMSSVVRELSMRNNNDSHLPGFASESRNHDHDDHGIIRELPDHSSSPDISELLDQSRRSFVSATDISLSPKSELSFDEVEDYANRESVRWRINTHFLGRSVRYVHSRLVSSFSGWKIFGNSQDVHVV